MAHLWASMRGRDPNFWEHFQKFSRDQFGIVYYEVNDQGEFVPRTTEPLSDAGFGNLYIGGIDPNKSGLITVAEAYQKIGEAGYLGKVDGLLDIATKQRMVDAAKLVISGLTDEDLKRKIPIWGEEQIKMFANGVGKTGTQSGVDKYGNWIAIRAGTYFMKYYPEVPGTSTSSAIPARVDVVGIMTAGKDASNNNIELGWAGQEVLPIASEVVQAVGVITSPQLAEDAIITLFTNPEAGQNYQLGAISVEQLYPFLKSLNPPNADGYSPYNALSEAILKDKTKYLFVDLIGVPIDGDVQTVSVHYINPDGTDRMFTLNVPANIIEPAGPAMNHFADHSSQTLINEILTKAVAAEPEKYGGLLAQLQSQGVTFVPVHDYETSPALFAIHEQMEKTGSLFSGGENLGGVIEKFGMDPKTTVFVNAELLNTYKELNPDVIKEQLFIQREFLNMAVIYENSGLPGALDSILYDKNMTSNPAYQLLRIFAETKTSQIFEPVSGERQFLIDKFQDLVSDPKNAETLAPDVIRAYNLYNEITSGIARGVAPTQLQSEDFIKALQNFTNTTKGSTLMSLGINPNPETQNSTPLPMDIIESVVPPPAEIVEITDSSILQTPLEIIDTFLKHPEDFSLSGSEKVKAKEVTEGAMAIVDIINSPKTVAIQNNEQKVDFVVKQLTDRGLNIDRSLVSSLIYDKQCVKGFLVLNDALAKEGIPGFINMQGRGKVPAVSFIYPLTNAIRRGETNTTFDSLFMQTVNKISDVHAGDAIVIYTPWMGSNEIKNPGHIAQVLFTGTHSDGSPYMIIFDTNGDGKGTTAIRIINNLEDFISQEAKDTQQYYPKSEPIFALIRPESQMMATP